MVAIYTCTPAQYDTSWHKSLRGVRGIFVKNTSNNLESKKVLKTV